MLLAVLLQAAPAASDGGIFEYVQYGVLGLIVIGFLLGLIWAKPAVDRLIKDKEAAEAQSDALIKTYEEQVIPLLREVDQKVVPAITELAQAVRDLRRDITYPGRKE